jgi:hypothetical protein
MASISRQLEHQYGAFYIDLRNVVNETDPIGLKGRIQLEEEYNPEISVILAKVSQCRSYDEVLRLVYDVFVKKFDPPVAGSPKKYKPIASKLCELAGIHGA